MTRPIDLTCTARDCRNRIAVPWSVITTSGCPDVRCPDHKRTKEKNP